jgi:catechol 2,3-dioxygenase-like lactoylglutathione lyase family enzyme
MSMVGEDHTLEVVAMRPFVPAKDFETSFRFYTESGFRAFRPGDGLASMHLGAFAFLRQDYYVEASAGNFMMHLLAKDFDAWWARVSGLGLSERFDVRAPAAPELQPWGLVVAYVVDPSGVLWRFAQDRDANPSRST